MRTCAQCGAPLCRKTTGELCLHCFNQRRHDEAYCTRLLAHVCECGQIAAHVVEFSQYTEDGYLTVHTLPLCDACYGEFVELEAERVG